MHPFDPALLGRHELLTPNEAAAYLRVSKSYLDKLRVYGGGPRFVRPGKRKILYRKSDLDEWLVSRSFQSTGEYEPSKSGNDVQQLTEASNDSCE
jgi:excisionase family DNA binding protein